MNRKGFTLIELLATLIILALVMSIGAYSIINIVKSTKQENYNFLIDSIKDGAEVYYQECKYTNNSGISCNASGEVTLGDLVRYGYLKGNSKTNSNNYTLINPLDNVNISTCTIKVSFSGGKIIVVPKNPTGSCPTSY